MFPRVDRNQTPHPGIRHHPAFDRYRILARSWTLRERVAHDQRSASPS